MQIHRIGLDDYRYVAMRVARESVETLALDYLVNRGCDETTADGSLQAIVDNAN